MHDIDEGKIKLGDSEPFTQPSASDLKELKSKRTREGGAGEQAGADRRAEGKILHPDDKVWICELKWSTE
jgi:hypothetical protein